MNRPETEKLATLIKTMRQLRSVNGCPWDREQTPESLRPYILEEAYELVDAINAGETSEILAELGDLLLQVVFLAQIFTEKGLFGLGEIAEGIDKKLKRRHPQLFNTEGTNQKHPNWEQIKRQELSEKGKETAFCARQPKNLPALKLADKYCRHLQKKLSPQPPTLRSANILQDAPQGAENIAAAIFNLVHHAQQQNIDADLALRKYVLQIASKVD